MQKDHLAAWLLMAGFKQILKGLSWNERYQYKNSRMEMRVCFDARRSGRRIGMVNYNIDPVLGSRVEYFTTYIGIKRRVVALLEIYNEDQSLEGSELEQKLTPPHTRVQ